MIIDGKEYKLFEELSQFEQDQFLFKKYWGAPIYSDKWREQVKENYKKYYGTDNLISIFGNYVVWKLDCNS